MSPTTYVYNKAKKNLMKGLFTLDSGTIKAAFLTSAYTPNIDTHEFYSDLTNELANAGNYTSGGFSLAGKTITVDTANDLAYFDADDISQASATFTFRQIAIYQSTGVAGASPLLCLIDWGVDRAYAGDTCIVQFAAGGIFKIT